MFIEEKGVVRREEVVEELGITRRTIERELNVLGHNDVVHSARGGKWETRGKKVKIT